MTEKFGLSGQRYYSKAVGVYLRGLYDGAVCWQCPACNHRWHRWPEGSRQYGLAERLVTPAAAE